MSKNARMAQGTEYKHNDLVSITGEIKHEKKEKLHDRQVKNYYEIFK